MPQYFTECKYFDKLVMIILNSESSMEPQDSNNTPDENKNPLMGSVESTSTPPETSAAPTTEPPTSVTPPADTSAAPTLTPAPNNNDELDKLGLVALITSILLGPVGIIIGILARRERKSGLSKAAIIVGIGWLVLAIAGIILLITLAAYSGVSDKAKKSAESSKTDSKKVDSKKEEKSSKSNSKIETSEQREKRLYASLCFDGKKLASSSGGWFIEDDRYLLLEEMVFFKGTGIDYEYDTSSKYDEIVAYLKGPVSKEKIAVELKGSIADDKTDPAKSKLAEQRAQLVQKELVNRGISASLIKIVPPLSENLDTAYGEGSQMNVDIRVLSNC